MAMSFIGKPISLISHSDVRYRGILAGIDPQASTIQLSNVYSMGTETRRPPTDFIPPVQEPYQYIIFRASEVKDLAVDEPVVPPATRPRNVHDDPAVLGASAPAAPAAAAPVFNYPNGAQQSGGYANAAKPPQPPQARPAAQAPPSAAAQPANARNQAPRARRTNSVHTATASLETVERAIGEMRITNHNGAPAARGRRGGAPPAREIKIPATDFDFESSNAKFDKKKPGEEESPANIIEVAEGEAAVKEKENAAYDPHKSFFDALSSSSGQRTAPVGGGPGPRRGGGVGRNRREEERERNVATFGEPGGVGLMGPGAYVGGWGGYGRRGGRPRRGHPPRGAPPAAAGRA